MKCIGGTVWFMPNGGTDNCGECDFGIPLEDRKAHCRIRDIVIETPYWTYCANSQVTNPDRIETPVGAVYVDAGGYPYRRAVHHSSPDGFVGERLGILRQAARGELDPRTRRLQVALIQDLARENAAEAIPDLVALALAKPGDLTFVGFPGPDAGTFDLSYRWETEAVRVEFVRLAALRALRKLDTDVSDAGVLDALYGHEADEDPDMVRRFNVAEAFLLDYHEPP